MNQLPLLSPEAAESSGARARALVDSLEKVVLGQRELLEDLVCALLAGGHVLLEGVPGTAKTLAVSALAQCLTLELKRIQFTPDLMPSDITGVGVFDPASNGFVFRPGPLFCDLCLCDEINRAPAKTQAALLEAMQEGRVTSDGATHTLPQAFTVFATQNPIEFEGTYPLPEAQLDRFLVKLRIDYPSEATEIHLLERYAAGFDARHPETFGIGGTDESSAPLGPESLAELRNHARAVRIDPELLGYVARLVRATREDPNLLIGASPRASVALYQLAKSRALLAGRNFATPDDVKDSCLAVLRHRVVVAAEAELDGVDADDRVRSALAAVPAPSIQSPA